MSLYSRMMMRPKNYESLDGAEKWQIDKGLGILDYDGNCDHNKFKMCSTCKKAWKEKFIHQKEATEVNA